MAPQPKVLFVLTSHNKLGDTGKPTGWYLVRPTLNCKHRKTPSYTHPARIRPPLRSPRPSLRNRHRLPRRRRSAPGPLLSGSLQKRPHLHQVPANQRVHLEEHPQAVFLPRPRARVRSHLLRRRPRAHV